jgi:hypothetical protein
MRNGVNRRPLKILLTARDKQRLRTLSDTVFADPHALDAIIEDPIGIEKLLRFLETLDIYVRERDVPKAVHPKSCNAAYLFVHNDPIGGFDYLGLKYAKLKDIIDKMKMTADIGKKIKDAIKNGKAAGLTPKASLQAFFGLGKMTNIMVSFLSAFPDDRDCSFMRKIAAGKCGGSCYCAAYDCALNMGLAAGSGALTQNLEKFFHKKICP